MYWPETIGEVRVKRDMSEDERDVISLTDGKTEHLHGMEVECVLETDKREETDLQKRGKN